jgi:glycosyltransferase involved in cell wall biosynthesis
MSDLVTIPVLTYNSSEFIVETLESIYNQTYKNIELIVSDDASQDNSVDVVKKWCAQSRVQERFSNVIHLKSKINIGIPANYNKCINASTGKWIKSIGGDDVLMPNCIEDNIQCIADNNEIKVLFSYLRIYLNSFEESNFIKLSPGSYPSHIINDSITAAQQYQLFLVSDRIPFTPSIFINKEALIQSGIPKEHLFSEDYQTKLNLTKAGYKLHFFEKETVYYRKHEGATNNMIQDYVLKPHYFKTEDFRKEYIYPYIPKDIKYWHQYNWFANQIFRIERLNRKTKFSSFLHYFLTSVLNPFKYIIFAKATFSPKYKNNIFYKK